jgi:hypothetical protein
MPTDEQQGPRLTAEREQTIRHRLALCARGSERAEEVMYLDDVGLLLAEIDALRVALAREGSRRLIEFGAADLDGRGEE